MTIVNESKVTSLAMRKGIKSDLPIFRERLHEALKDLDLSQRQLAFQIGKDPRTIGHVFTGPVHPDLGTLRDLCEKLNVSADYLLGLGQKSAPVGGGVVIKHFASFHDAFRGGEPCHIGITTLPEWDGATGDIVAFTMTSDNLNHPIVEDGDIIYVDKGVTEINRSSFYINRDATGTCWMLYINASDEPQSGESVYTRIYFEGTRGYKQGNEERVQLSADYFDIVGKVMSKRTTRFL